MIPDPMVTFALALERVELKQHYIYWRTLSAGRMRDDGTYDLPRRRDVDPTHIPHLLGHLAIIEFEPRKDEATPEAERLLGTPVLAARYRLMGTAITTQLGEDRTNGLVTVQPDREAIDPHAATMLHALGGMLRHGRPVLARARILAMDDRRLTLERLLTPLADDGETINRALVSEFICVDRGGRRIPLKMIQGRADVKQDLRVLGVDNLESTLSCTASMLVLDGEVLGGTASATGSTHGLAEQALSSPSRLPAAPDRVAAPTGTGAVVRPARAAV